MQDPDFFIPPDLQKGWSDVKLYKGRIECPSCHNPHDPANVAFLRKSMKNSGLCATCHNK
ncbi:cytochrome c3 family protein [Pseudomonadota bacterium]